MDGRVTHTAHTRWAKDPVGGLFVLESGSIRWLGAYPYILESQSRGGGEGESCLSERPGTYAQ